MKLNIGGVVEGYVNVDRKLGTEAYPLDFPDNHFEETRCSHVLEHFPRADIEKVLREWVRVLKPGGSLKIAVPDFDYIVAHQDDPLWQGYLFGGQMDDDDFHHACFTDGILTALLGNAGLVDVRKWEDEIKDSHLLPVSLNLAGTKPASSCDCFARDVHCPHENAKSDKPVKIIAVMSCPRLAWTDTLFCIQQAMMPLGIEVFRHSGVFWGQGLTKLMKMALEQGADYIITLDYDTVYERRHVQRLCQLMVENDDVDAIVSVQVRRENDYSMFTMRGTDGELRTKVARSEFKTPLTPITTGQFGLTIIRASSMARLPKPWFLATPDKNGEWEDGHVDEDIYFWHNAERSGWTVCMANEVRIGHLQNMIAWPTDDFTPLHQYVSKWNDEGQPVEAGGSLRIKELKDGKETKAG